MQTAQQLWLRVNGASAVARLLARLDAEQEGSADWNETNDKLLKKILICGLEALFILAKIGMSSLNQTT